MFPLMPRHVHQLFVLLQIFASLEILSAPGERALDPLWLLGVLAQDVQTEPLGAGPCNAAILANGRFILPAMYLMDMHSQP